MTAAVGVAVSIVAFLAYGLSAATAMWLLAANGRRWRHARRRREISARAALRGVAGARHVAECTALARRRRDDRPGIGHGRRVVRVLTVGLGLAAASAGGSCCASAESRAATVAVPWNEAFVLAGVSAAGMLFIQLERLVIPHRASVADLALFGVLGAIAGSLFRLLQMAVGFSLLPRLRSAVTVFERRALIARELRFAIVMAAVGTAAILVLTPLVERLVSRGQVSFVDESRRRSVVQRRRQDRARVRPRDRYGARHAARARARQRRRLVVGRPRRRRRGRRGTMGTHGRHLRHWLRLARWAVVSFVLVMHHLRLPAGLPAET